MRQGREPLEGRARVRLGGPGARQGRVPVPHSTAPFSLGGHPWEVAGMGPGLTPWWWGGRGWVLCWTGVLASRRVVWVLRARALRFLRSLAGCCVEVRVGGG